MRSVLTRPQAPAGEHNAPRGWLLLAGLGAFAVALGLYVIYMVIHPKSFTMDPVDLAVYRSGGLIVRHVRPLYDPRLAAPLYDWVGYGKLHLPFPTRRSRPSRSRSSHSSPGGCPSCCR